MKKARKDRDALDVDRPEQFLKRERLAQQVGTGLMSLFALAGLAGLFGNGPLSEATVTNGAATLRYERFARQTYRTALEVSVEPANGPTIAITMPRSFLDRIDMVEVRPANTLRRLDANVAIFEVPAVNGAATLHLHYEPKEYGVLVADIAAGGQPAASVRQIVFF